MLKKNKWLNRNIWGFGLTSFFNDFSHEMTTAILPAFIGQLTGGVNASIVLGIITGVSNAVSSLIKVWSGILTDKIKNYKLFLIIGYAITPLFVALIGSAQYIWQILIYKTFAWAGRGMREPMRDTWITDITDSLDYGKAFGFVRALDTLGAIAGPLVAFIALKFYSLRTIFFLSLIPGILSVLSLIFLTKEELKNTKIYKYISFKENLKKLPKKFNYFVFIMLFFGISNFSKLLIIYRAQEIFSINVSALTATGWTILLYILFNIIRAISEFGIGSLSDFMNRKNLLAILGFGFFSITNLMLILSSAKNWIWVLIFLCVGISTGTVTALEKAYSAQLLPEEVRGTGFGILQMIDGIGDLISSIFVGFLWSFISPEFAFFYAAIFSAISAYLLISFKDKNIIKEKN